MSQVSRTNKTPLLVDEQDVQLDGSDTSSELSCAIKSPYDVSKIRIEPKNLTLDLIAERIRNEEMDLMPDFQRQAGIWNEKAQSRLIESLLLRIPIPAFYFDATNNDKWIVVDGLQRLTAINRFVIDESLALKDLEFLGEEYNGATFSRLPRPLQRTIKETILVTYLIMDGTPEEVKFNVFQRINTGGLPLSSQEIRHALNQGKITKLLEILADHEDFKQATTKSISSKRMDDRECVARFITFSIIPPQKYDRNDYDAFLNAGMKKANNLSDKKLDMLRENFLRVMRWSYKIFGNNAFRKCYEETEGRYPINKALFEAWSVNLGLLSDEQLSLLVKRKDKLVKYFIRLMHNREFESAISQGTGSTARVKLRFNSIKNIIDEVLNA